MGRLEGHIEETKEKSAQWDEMQAHHVKIHEEHQVKDTVHDELSKRFEAHIAEATEKGAKWDQAHAEYDKLHDDHQTRLAEKFAEHDVLVRRLFDIDCHIDET